MFTFMTQILITACLSVTPDVTIVDPPPDGDGFGWSGTTNDTLDDGSAKPGDILCGVWARGTGWPAFMADIRFMNQWHPLDVACQARGGELKNVVWRTGGGVGEDYWIDGTGDCVKK